MTIEHIDIQETIEKAKALIQDDDQMSVATKSMFEILILVITLLVNRLNLNSKNSSKSPSSDPNRKRQPRKKTENKTGGQDGHVGTTLKRVDNPDVVEEIKIDRRTLPAGKQYSQIGYETRQVFDIDITRVVTEYRSQILKDQHGNQYVAPFPKGVNKAVQYGSRIKAHSVYMSQYQLLPYNRVQEYFADQLNIPISEGSIFNFNKEAFDSLSDVERRVQDQLKIARLAHADETGINVGGKRHWLHCMSNDLWTCYFPHAKRGTDAMNALGILPHYKGILCHDHWKPYFKYTCTHSLCNAHHLRELERAWEQDEQEWAKQMKTLLEEINSKVIDAGGALDINKSREFRKTYKNLLKQADCECPEPPPKEKGKRGRVKKTKSRNLLERLRIFEDDVLRFMEIDYVPFTNNLGERDIRMTKVQQKISGCFRSIDGAQIFCRIRGYLSTCRKHGVSSTYALECLFQGTLPDFLLHN
ncbi:MAG: IS66 family transposase [Thermodesulfobacteriota bacterium]|nr:IS66 family transposase [Thermodesulfobacteriota bacterium]